MAEYKVVDTEQLDSDLTSVASAIRTKTYTNEELVFPEGFISAINSIEGGDEDTQALIKKAKTHEWMQEHYILYKKDAQNILFSNNPNVTEIPEFVFSQVTNFYRMFMGCTGLTKIPSMDTSNGENFGEMFRNCTSLSEIPPLNTSKGTNMYRMFNGWKGLSLPWTIDTTNVTNFERMFDAVSNIEEITLTSTYNGTNFAYMFQYCSKLKTISTLDLSNCTNTTNMFTGCPNLENITFEPETIKISISITSSKLTDGTNGVSNSIQSIIDGLADLTGQEAQTLTLHADVRAKLTDDQLTAITNKNWNLA